MNRKVIPSGGRRVLILCLAGLALLTYGYFIGEAHVFPRSLIDTVQDWLTSPWPPYVEVDDQYYETDPEILIDIVSAEDITAKRDLTVRFVWGPGGFPHGAMPTQIDTGISDERWMELPNLQRIDRLTTELDWGLNDITYHFIPEKGNGRLIIYHQGHRGDFYIGERTIRFFLAEGYAVLGMAMPLRGLNNQPVVRLQRFGRFKLQDHKHFVLIPPAEGHQLKYFLDPVARAVNYALDTWSYEHTAMIGISGGGWTTTLYAAMDTRIRASYPVAGTYPIYLRSDASGGTWGDYEQTLIALYRQVNYLELYMLGSCGPGRRQLQIINQFDSCCFYGKHFQTYETQVAERVTALGAGSFSVYLDDSHKGHQISVPVLELVLGDQLGE